MKRLLRPICFAASLTSLLGAASAFAQETPPAGAAAPAGFPPLAASADADAEITPEQIERLEKMLSGCTLVGHFTVNGAGDVEPRDERYELASVKHMKGNMWLVTARIKYGDHDVTLPLPLPIRWAGDTPVISLDAFAVPGMGAFSARVMFYEDHYMGYWFASGNKEHGGYMFGEIEPPKAEGESTPAEDGAAK